MLVHRKRFVPKKGLVLRKSLPRTETGAYTLAFWVRPWGLQPTWTNLLHHGASNKQRNPMVSFVPLTTR